MRTVLPFLLATVALSAPAPVSAEMLETTVETTPADRDKTGAALTTFKAKQSAVLKLVRGKAAAPKLQKAVDGLLDYEWIAQTALGGPARYEKKCAPRCEEFEVLLTQLIRENYLKRIRMADKGSMNYTGEQRRATASKITTEVSYKQNGRQQTLEIAYVMHRKDSSWQVRDIITDGVSLARNYKYEFNKILREQGIDGLISRLQSKIAEVAKN